MSNYRFETAAADTATLTSRVYETLREEILTGECKPGKRLVRRLIARRLGVSPLPVTEALFRLELEGLVESRPLCGCRVRPMTLDDVRNDEVLREAIECQAARRCAENATPAELKRLMTQARLLDRMMSGGGPHSKLGMNTHFDFHRAIAEAGKFPVLVDELQRVWFRRLMRLSWVKATHYQRVPKGWHQQLVKTLAARDPDKAEAEMRRHVRFGCEDDRAAFEFLWQTSEPEIAAESETEPPPRARRR